MKLESRNKAKAKRLVLCRRMYMSLDVYIGTRNHGCITVHRFHKREKCLVF